MLLEWLWGINLRRSGLGDRRGRYCNAGVRSGLELVVLGIGLGLDSTVAGMHGSQQWPLATAGMNPMQHISMIHAPPLLALDSCVKEMKSLCRILNNGFFYS